VIAGALAYAKIGWRVHPCRPGEKLPILQDWPARATTNADLIDRWWGRTTDANVGVATGSESGFFVLDVDGPEGERSLVALERQHGPLPELYPQQWTGSGHGWQAFFSWPEGREIRNSAGRLGSKLDIRADGGFVVLPPSLHPSGNRYRWAVDRSPWHLPPEPAPDWLVDLLDPPSSERKAYAYAYAYAYDPGEDRYVLKALESELALVASAPEGRRNEQLNESAFNLFRFVLDGKMAADPIVHSLTAAASHAGLLDREIQSTIRSAAQARGVSL